MDPVEIAQHYTRFLKEDKRCDLVICLSHLGYEYPNQPEKISDRILASKTEHLDLILGGHTHTFLKEPQSVQNSSGRTVIINQVGWAGLLLGRLDFFFDHNKKIQNISWRNQVIDHQITA